MQVPQAIAALAAITATATSKAIDLSRQEHTTVQFTCANHSSGNGVFSIDASNDGTNWTTGIAFQDGTATASTTFITSKTLSSNTSAMAIVPAGYLYIRVVCTVTTDGTYTAMVFSN